MRICLYNLHIIQLTLENLSLPIILSISSLVKPNLEIYLNNSHFQFLAYRKERFRDQSLSLFSQNSTTKHCIQIPSLDRINKIILTSFFVFFTFLYFVTKMIQKNQFNHIYIFHNISLDSQKCNSISYLICHLF